MSQSRLAIPRASSSRIGTTRGAIPKKSSTSSAAQQKEFTLPALSIPKKIKKESEVEKMKRKTIRRNAPPGEDLKQIKNIIKTLKGTEATVQEFISLIAPSTGDTGSCLRHVLNEDLVAFRKLAKKVYEMMTQDNSDVLLNQQLQLAEYYKEKKEILHYKMMRAIAEIYGMVPNFDFERYNHLKDKYLNEVLPLPDDLILEPEEVELLKRQAAYHRLQWLRSEGERLNEENNSLKRRLNQMKRQHMEEQRRMADRERQVEIKREQLEEQEAEKRETLETLNESLEKTIITQEKTLRKKKDDGVLAPRAQGAVAKTKSKTKAKFKRRPKWNEDAAREIEERAIESYKQGEGAKVRSPFHFSPIKTPPPQAARQLSPFHYSPPKDEAAYVSPPRSAPMPQTRARAPPPRTNRAPADSWGGYY